MASNAPVTPRSVSSSTTAAVNEAAHGPSNLDIFIRNLRLLNLDQLSDAPPNFGQIFGENAHISQKDRVRHTEWALYRLFELWDRKKTQNQLGSLFPPMVPLQSLKLRTALYRWIYDLKQDGTLSKECMLRKSTLDECKGTKFEEMLMLFSTAVLRKVEINRRDSNNKSRKSRNTTLGLALKSLDEQDQANCSPLILAHKFWLSAFLRDQNSDKMRIKTIKQTLISKESIIQNREKEASDLFTELEERSAKAGINLQNVQSQVREHWPEGNRWLDNMLNVDSSDSRDLYLEDSFEHIWERSFNLQALEYDAINASLLNNLQSRLNIQTERLDRWRVFQNQLSSRVQVISQTPRKTPARSARPTPIKSPKKSPIKSPSKLNPGRKMAQSPQKLARNVMRAAEQDKITSLRVTKPDPRKYEEIVPSALNPISDATPREQIKADSIARKDAILLDDSITSSPSLQTKPSVRYKNLEIEIAKRSELASITSSLETAVDNVTGHEVHITDYPPTPTPTPLSLAERAQISLARAQMHRSRAQSSPRTTIHAETPIKSPSAASESTTTTTPITTAVASTSSHTSHIAPLLPTPQGPSSRPSPNPRSATHRKTASTSTSASTFPGSAAPSTPTHPRTVAESVPAAAAASAGASEISTPAPGPYAGAVDVDDEDCASVFKSRPKLKTSPVGSGERVEPVPWAGV